MRIFMDCIRDAVVVMNKTLLAAAILIIVACSAWPDVASAEGCRVRIPGTYALGDNVYDQMCDQNENRPVTIGTYLRTEEAATIGSYVSIGSGSNEVEICATACTLHSISFYNGHTADVYGRCVNTTAANTTPGAGTITLRIGAGTKMTGDPRLPPTLGVSMATALTCWFVTDITDAGTTSAPVNTVFVTWSKK